MNGAKRRLLIFEQLKEAKSVEVKQLAKQYEVSPMTIRRDLSLFAKQGLVSLNYGGAILNEGSGVEASFSLKAAQAQSAKAAIAKEAARLVNEGETILLDCGTTTYEMAEYLSDKAITVITNSWKILQVLQNTPKIKVILAPGTYSRISQGAISSDTIRFIGEHHVDHVFMSTQGLDLAWGASVPDEMDANVKQALMKAGSHCILLADQNKFDQRYFARYAKIDEFDLVISDRQLEEAEEQALKQMRTGYLQVIVHSA